MIMTLCNKISKKVIEIIGNDKEIQNLLVFNHSTDNEPVNLEYMIKNKYITNYPVVLSGNDKNFINVYMDNAMKTDDNIYVSTFNISCGVNVDSWSTDNGDTRINLIAERLETLLDGLRLEGCSGEFNLNTISNITWSQFLNGYALLFQIVEMDDVDETIL